MEGKELHDALLAIMPPSAEHPAAECQHCSAELRDNREVARSDDDPKGGQVTDPTFSKEQLDEAVAAAVAKATAPLQSELDKLRAEGTQSEIDAAVAAAVGERDAKIEELGNQVDVLTAERDKARQDLQAQTDYLTAAKAELDEQAEIAARKEDRVAKVKEAAPTFSDEKVAERADDWAKMEDAAFEAFVNDLRLAAGANDGGPPRDTALNTTREHDALGGGAGDGDLAEVVGARIHRPAVARLA